MLLLRRRAALLLAGMLPNFGCSEDSSGRSRVDAISLSSGTTAWSHELDGWSATPFAVESEPDQIMLVSSDDCWAEQRASFFERSSGAVLATGRTAERPPFVPDTCAETPIANAIGTSTLCIVPGPKRAGCSAYGRTDGFRKWAIDAGECTVLDGQVFLSSGEGTWLLEPESGARLLSLTGQRPLGISKDYLFVVSNFSPPRVSAVELRSGAERWSRPLEFDGADIVDDILILTRTLASSPCHIND